MVFLWLVITRWGPVGFPPKLRQAVLWVPEPDEPNDPNEADAAGAVSTAQDARCDAR